MSAPAAEWPAVTAPGSPEGQRFAARPQPVESQEPARRRPWQPVDLDDVLEGHYVPPLPTVGRRRDGAGLFYPGRVHSVASESEAGKTWLALHAVTVELAAGNGAVYLDFEDDEGGLVGRLLSLGVDRRVLRERFAYLRPDESISNVVNAADLGQVLGDLRPSLVVLDGITEAMTLHGLDGIDNRHVAVFGKLLPRRIAAHGAAVVNLDHVPKSTENRGRYAIGGQHKLAGLNGAAFTLENRTPFGIGLTGRSTVLVVKDRPGQLRRNALPSAGGAHWYADLVLDSQHEEFVEATIEVPAERAESFRPTVLMSRVSDALTRAGEPLAVRGVLDRVQGKRAQDVRTALAALVDEGYVVVENGSRGSHLHRLVKPYGKDEE
jgi:hypothetical protein